MKAIHRIFISTLILFFTQASLAATVTETREGTVSSVGDNLALSGSLSIGDTINWGITYEDTDIMINEFTETFDITSIDLSEINTLLTSAGLTTASFNFGLRQPGNFDSFFSVLGEYEFTAGAAGATNGRFLQRATHNFFSLSDVMIVGSVTVPSAVPIPATVWLFGWNEKKNIVSK